MVDRGGRSVTDVVAVVVMDGPLGHGLSFGFLASHSIELLWLLLTSKLSGGIFLQVFSQWCLIEEVGAVLISDFEMCISN